MLLPDTPGPRNLRMCTCTAQAWGQKSRHGYMSKEAPGVHRSSEDKGDATTATLSCTRRKARDSFSAPGSPAAPKQSHMLQAPSVHKLYIGRSGKSQDTHDRPAARWSEAKPLRSGGTVHTLASKRKETRF